MSEETKECYGIIGNWCVYYRVPQPQPKKIKYKYPFESEWHEIEGDRYELDEEHPQFTGGQCKDKAYRIIFNGTFYDGYGGSLGIFYGEFLSGVTGRITSIQPYVVPVNSDHHDWYARVTVTDINDVVTVYERPIVATNYNNYDTTSYWWYYSRYNSFPRTYQANLVGVFRADGTTVAQDINECGDNTGDCTIKIYSSENILILNRKEDVCPTVEEVPAKCDFSNANLSEWQSVGTIINSDDDGYLLTEKYEENGFKNIRVQHCFNNLLPPTSNSPPEKQFSCLRIIDGVHSSKDCNKYPEVKVDCNCGDSNDKKCPPETCFECINGDTKCCFDAHLNLIKEINL